MVTDKRSREDWVELHQAQKKSGQAVTEWCKANNININTFWSMKKKIAKSSQGQKATTTPSQQWVELKESTTSSSALVATDIQPFTLTFAISDMQISVSVSR